MRTARSFLISFIMAAFVLGTVPFVSVTYATTALGQPDVCANPGTPDIAQACSDYVTEIAKLKELQARLSAQKAKSGAYQKDVNALIRQISIAQMKIRAEINTIALLAKEISKKQQAITSLANELDREHRSMGQLLTRTDEIDQKGAAYVLLSAKSVSDFYQDLDYFYAIKHSLYASLNHVKTIKSSTEDQKQQLQDKQYQAQNAENALQHQKARLATSQKQAQELLDSSKNAEQQQAALIAEQQKKVAEIESKLFTFAGGATKAIPFKDAYAYATTASNATGVSPAFILAILTQESNLGKNVGTCNRAGDPPSKSYVNIMNPTRDQPAFLRITAALGLNPETTPVSCPIGGGGWGGAMGPAQFIPSTWERIASEVASALGKSAANPWAARDAIMAAGIYLKDRGAVGGERTERNAACRYYSGRACDGRKPANSFYGNDVMSLKRSIQADIDYLNTYGVSRR